MKLTQSIVLNLFEKWQDPGIEVKGDSAIDHAKEATNGTSMALLAVATIVALITLPILILIDLIVMSYSKETDDGFEIITHEESPFALYEGRLEGFGDLLKMNDERMGEDFEAVLHQLLPIDEQGRLSDSNFIMHKHEAFTRICAFYGFQFGRATRGPSSQICLIPATNFAERAVVCFNQQSPYLQRISSIFERCRTLGLHKEASQLFCALNSQAREYTAIGSHLEGWHAQIDWRKANNSNGTVVHLATD